jgi:hypothetical protein
MSSSNLAVARNAFEVVPSDTVKFDASARALYVGAGGNITLVTASNAVVRFVNVPQGSTLPVECVRVNATGTTATSLVGLV